MRHCERTRKRKFLSEAVATNAARIVALQTHSRGGVYLCPWCDSWHLTKQVNPPKPGTVAVEWEGVRR